MLFVKYFIISKFEYSVFDFNKQNTSRLFECFRTMIIFYFVLKICVVHMYLDFYLENLDTPA